jgi:hypothetical protein
LPDVPISNALFSAFAAFAQLKALVKILKREYKHMRAHTKRIEEK